MEERTFEKLEDYNICVDNLVELRKQRNFVLAGTIGCAALIVSNITTSTELLMTGTVIFPSLFNCLSNVQKEINRNQRTKNAYINGETIGQYKDTIEIEYDLGEHIPDFPGYTTIRKIYHSNKVAVTYVNTSSVFKPANTTVGRPLTKQLR